jgi:hypothetical protein
MSSSSGVLVWGPVSLFLPWLSLDECIAPLTVAGRLDIALFSPRHLESETFT